MFEGNETDTVNMKKVPQVFKLPKKKVVKAPEKVVYRPVLGMYEIDQFGDYDLVSITNGGSKNNRIFSAKPRKNKKWR